MCIGMQDEPFAPRCPFPNIASYAAMADVVSRDTRGVSRTGRRPVVCRCAQIYDGPGMGREV
jgi:hypothetical protein